MVAKHMRSLLGAMVVWCICGEQASAGTSSAIADSLYQAALDRVGDVPAKESLKAFKRVIRDDGEYAPAYYEIAKLYIALDTPMDRASAQKALKRALVLDPENMDYQLKMGELLGVQGFWANANRHYRKILETHPDNAEATYFAGFYAMQDFLKYIDRIAVVKSQGGGAYSAESTLTPREEKSQGDGPSNAESTRMPRERRRPHAFEGAMESVNIISLREFGEEDRDKATGYMEQTIRLNPTNRKAYYHLAVIRFESGDPGGLITVAKRLLEQFPDDKDALLFCALGYQFLGEMDVADSYYTRARSQMGPAELAVMDDVGLVSTKDDLKQLAISTEVQREETDGVHDGVRENWGFWKKQDPLFLTPYNERRMEHYGRIAYANLRFASVRKRMPGWQTDMGKAYIRFGRYIRRQSQLGPGGGIYETWYYSGFRIVFHCYDGLDSFRFSVTGVSSKWVFDKTPPEFNDPYLLKKYSLPHQVVAFQEGDSVRVEVSYALPKDRLEFLQGSVDLDDGLFFFDEGWHDIHEEVMSGVLTWPSFGGGGHTRADSLRGMHLVSSRKVHVQPAAHHIVAEVRDWNSGAIGTFRELMTFSLQDTLLAISDLLVARSIEPVIPFPESRQDLRILPNPTRTYHRSESICIYLEVYNLERNPYGRTKYTISYRLGPPMQKEIDPALFADQDLAGMDSRNPVRSAIEDLYGGEGYKVKYVVPKRNRISSSVDSRPAGSRGRAETTVSVRYEGDREDDFTYLQIDLGQVPGGIHSLTITVKDLSTGNAVEREVLFRVVE